MVEYILIIININNIKMINYKKKKLIKIFITNYH